MFYFSMFETRVQDDNKETAVVKDSESWEDKVKKVNTKTKWTVGLTTFRFN